MSIRIHLGTEDLANIRFAFSAASELLASLRVLADPARHAIHLPWADSARKPAEGFPLLRALVAPEGLVPDFITPTPEGPFPEFGEELERVRSATPDQVRQEARDWRESLDERLHAGRISASFAERAKNFADALVSEPERWIPAVADEMQGYWDTLVAPHWPRIRALLEGDVLARARELALGGPDQLFDNLTPRISWRDGALHIEHAWDHDEYANGRGMLLIPSAFIWPGVSVQVATAGQPWVAYPSRGVVELWESDVRRTPPGLGELIGEARASILRVIDLPMTTGEIAARLGVTPAAVSQQLAILRRTGVVRANRVGRGVYSSRTPLGDSLLGLFG